MRGRGLLVAVGFPTAALFVLVVWFRLHGATITTSLPAVVLLIALTALADRIDVVVSPRTQVSPGHCYVVAAALIGGPLVGACAGISMEAFDTGAVWRKRFAWVAPTRCKDSRSAW